MRKLNLIVVFNENLEKALFCIRAKEPYKGLYNFVGGKVEENESDYYDYAFVFGFIDFSFLNLIMLFVVEYLGIILKLLMHKEKYNLLIF